jgi:hypothetical protein
MHRNRGRERRTVGQKISIAEPHHFFAAFALTPGKNLDPDPTLLYSKSILLKNKQELAYSKG